MKEKIQHKKIYFTEIDMIQFLYQGINFLNELEER